jgi:uncharacterized protein
MIALKKEKYMMIKKGKYMTIKYALIMPALWAGALYMTTISPTRGQAIHGESIDDAAPAVAARPATNSAVTDAGGVLKAEFEMLASYEFDVADTSASNRVAMEYVTKLIPEAIKKLDGKVVRIRGFMIPVKESAGKATEFLISRNQPSCCYSGVTALNEFITVKTSGKGVDEIMDEVVAVEGTLHVGLITDEYAVVGVYQMDGAKMIEAEN